MGEGGLGQLAATLTLHRLKMADREEKSLLPTSLPEKREKVKRGRFPLKRVFRWLHVLTTCLLVCWFSLITLKSWRSDANRMLPEEVIRQLMNNEEVRELMFYLLNMVCVMENFHWITTFRI